MKWIIAAFLIASCGEPKGTFTVLGRTVSVAGRIKPGAKVTVEEAKSAAQMRVDFLDSLKK